jgi:FKBP-type peptidyl-prolyl cis-trans isomerase
MKNSLFHILALLLLLAACKEYKQTEGGVGYKFHTQAEGRRIAYGDFVKFHLRILTPENDTLYSTYKENKPVELTTGKSYQGSIMEALVRTRVGDSATFLISADVLLKNEGKLPDGAKPGTNLKYVIKILEAENGQAKKEREQKEFFKQLAKDELAIQKHLKDYKEEGFQKHQKGFYYKVIREGEGDLPVLGDSIRLTYLSYKLNDMDTVADASINEVPGLVLGKDRRISAWEMALPLFARKSASFIIICPSYMCFGTEPKTLYIKGTGAVVNLPPNTPLRFEFGIRDVIKGPFLDSPPPPL